MLNTLPDLHKSFAEQLKLKFQSDSRIHSLLAGGSIVHGGFDKYSDLDFVVVVDTLHYDEIMTQRRELAGTLGHLLHAFTGEHVGEPRLLICLYGPELLHVDLKFVTLEMLTQRVEEPAVLFTRDNTALQRQLAKFSAHWPDMSPEWFESRARSGCIMQWLSWEGANSSKRLVCCHSSVSRCWGQCCTAVPIFRNVGFAALNSTALTLMAC